LELQGRALRLNRTLQIICNYPESFSYEYYQIILARIQTTAPLHVAPWKAINVYLFDTFVDLSYILINGDQIDNYTTKYVYELYHHRDHTSVCHQEMLHPHFDWKRIFQNIQFLTPYPMLLDTWYRIVHNIYPTNSLLYEKGIITDPLCHQCNVNEDLEHILTQCCNNAIIWKQYLKMVAVILRTSIQHLNFDTLIKYPEYKYYPPTKRKFLLWLTSTTIQLCLDKPDIPSVHCYKQTLLYRLSQIPYNTRKTNFANFHTVFSVI
jgi:hypothetical protein